MYKFFLLIFGLPHVFEEVANFKLYKSENKDVVKQN